MRYFMGKAETESAIPVLQYEGIHIDLFEVASEERIDLEIIKYPFHRDDFDFEIELHDLFDRDRQRTLLMKLLQEFFRKPPQVIVREDCGLKHHQSRLANRVNELFQ